MIEPDGTNERGISPHGEQLSGGEVLYACPACGVVVTSHNPAAMRLHHLHVINAPPEDWGVEAFRNRMQAERAENQRHAERQARTGSRRSTGLAGD